MDRIGAARAEALPDALSPSLRMRALGRLGRLERQWGDTRAARLHLMTALTLAEESRRSSDRELAYCLGTLANIESDVGAHERGGVLARQALAACAPRRIAPYLRRDIQYGGLALCLCRRA